MADLFYVTAKETTAREAVIHEAGDLDAELNTPDNRNKAKRLKQFNREIQGWYENEAARQAFSAAGDRYRATVSAKANKREYKPGAMRRLAKFLGDAFYGLCGVTPEDFDDHAKFVVESQTGSRRVELIAKVEAKAA